MVDVFLYDFLTFSLSLSTSTAARGALMYQMLYQCWLNLIKNISKMTVFCPVSGMEMAVVVTLSPVSLQSFPDSR